MDSQMHKDLKAISDELHKLRIFLITGIAHDERLMSDEEWEKYILASLGRPPIAK